MKLAGQILLASLLMLAGCGDDTGTPGAASDGGSDGGGSNQAPPMMIPGGGTSSGAIDGIVNVYVIDERTRAPIVGAAVRLGASSDASPRMGTTDGTGLSRFEDGALHGKQTLTASFTGYAPATWIGVNAANVTMPLRPKSRVTPPIAMVSGTIAGWNMLPVPMLNHITAASVGFSATNRFNDPANDVGDQGMRQIMVGMATAPIAANSCVRGRLGTAMVSDCNWSLKTRPGPQTHYAVIMDVDTKGTAADTDDTRRLIGYAILRGLNLTANQTLGGEMLAQIAAADTTTLTAIFAAAPSGLDASYGLPILRLGDEGMIPLFLMGALSPMQASMLVPKLTGPLATASYDLIGRAQDAPGDERPVSSVWLRAVNLAGAVNVGNWMAPPTGLSATGGSYFFTPTAGATLHSVEITRMMPGGTTEPIWTIGLLDGTASFTLPTLSPDPWPAAGTSLTMDVSADDLPGVDLGNFRIDDFESRVARVAQDSVTFAR